MQEPSIEAIFEDMDFIAGMITEETSQEGLGRIESIIRHLALLGFKTLDDKRKSHPLR